MLTFSLGSGSNGNAIFVKAGHTCLLFDAGLSGVQVKKRLATRGVDVQTVNAVVLSHDHSDHICGAGVLHRRHGIPLYWSQGTAQTCLQKGVLGSMGTNNVFNAGESFRIGEALVHTIPTPHDAQDGVCFVVEHEGQRLGILTDLGCVFSDLCTIMPTLDAVYLESNYDPEMLLENKQYPRYLKERILGPRGHISNTEAAMLIREHTKGRLQWVVLSHLSENNNTPQLALETAENLLKAHAKGLLTIGVASRYEASQAMKVCAPRA